MQELLSMFLYARPRTGDGDGAGRLPRCAEMPQLIISIISSSGHRSANVWHASASVDMCQSRLKEWWKEAGWEKREQKQLSGGEKKNEKKKMQKCNKKKSDERKKNAPTVRQSHRRAFLRMEISIPFSKKREESIILRVTNMDVTRDRNSNQWDTGWRMADYIRPPFRVQDNQCSITWGAIGLKQNDPLNAMESRCKQEVHNPLKKKQRTKSYSLQWHIRKPSQTHCLSAYRCRYYFDGKGSIWLKIKELFVSSSVCTVND